MTRKSYGAMARVIAEEIPPEYRRAFAERLAGVLRADNPRFNRRLFFEACRLPGRVA